eukprot:2761901-Pyramimonas_sp.AAC.1
MAAYPALCSSVCSHASLVTSTPLGLISGRAVGGVAGGVVGVAGGVVGVIGGVAGVVGGVAG